MIYVQLSDLFLASPYAGTAGPYLSWPHITHAVANAPPGIIAWMAVNIFYDRVLQLPRFTTRRLSNPRRRSLCRHRCHGYLPFYRASKGSAPKKCWR